MKIILEADEVKAIVERTMRRRLALNDHYKMVGVTKPSVYSDEIHVEFEHAPTAAKTEAAKVRASEPATEPATAAPAQV